ncbi:SCO family protein [Cohnella terricola]|uniref:SCO family protein n=1 Tax=Cohnella terricola TaxID=1289167 RepID=A0A559JQ51_9BACL|nr:SCO family protein [Cohnella terricola]TVY01990.1 SCO family protein [Cohnella terricola]
MASDSVKRQSGKYFFPVVLLTVVVGLAGYFIFRSLPGESALPVVKPAPDFEIENLDGQTVKASQNKGKIVLLEFMFTSCPDICPLTTYKMSKLQEQFKEKGLFGDRVRFVSITFDPEQDTPEVLRKYAQRMNIDFSGWDLWRGEEKQTIEIASKYGVTVQNMGDGQFVHTVTSLNLIDADQRIRKVYKMGDEMDNEEIIADIASLLSESER